MFQGSMVALVTPMFENGAIDWEALKRLIDWHIESGTSAIVAVGTTGESATLNVDEHLAVIKFTQDYANGRIPVIAGTGGNSTQEAIELSLSAYRFGCAATLQVTPYYNRPPQRGLMHHFTKIAETVPMPHILYNVPSRTSCDLLPETVAELAQIPNIIGIKEASTYERLVELKKVVPADFELYSGEDGICAKAFANDLIRGVISVTANVVPRLMAEMMVDKNHAVKLNSRLEALHQAMFCECNPLPAKWALYRMGRIPKGIRSPLVELSAEKHSVVESALKGVGVSL